MDLDRLALSPVGQLVPVRGTDARHGAFAYFAFLAAPLPDDVQLTSSTWTAIADATAAVSRLQQACLQLPDPRLLIKPALWREALDTSALEGTDGVLRELLEAHLPTAHFMSSETREIQAFEVVALAAFSIVKERPVSTNLLCELQGELFRLVDQKPQDVGRIRNNIVWIGQKDRPIEEARFVPAPPDDRLRAGMDQWERWVQHQHQHLPLVLRAAMAHYQLETLHPFCDGNGRIGRLVVTLQALTARALDEPALTISTWLFRHRDRYQRELLNMSCTGDWNPWVQLFCEAVSSQCDVLIQNAHALVKWLRESQHAVQERRWTGVINRLLDDLIEWPIITISLVAGKYGCTVVQAGRTVDHLVEIGVLTELTGRDYGRVFGATEVMATVDTIRAVSTTGPELPSSQSPAAALA
jgi:Fic family protein